MAHNLLRTEMQHVREELLEELRTSAESLTAQIQRTNDTLAQREADDLRITRQTIHTEVKGLFLVGAGTLVLAVPELWRLIAELWRLLT